MRHLMRNLIIAGAVFVLCIGSAHARDQIRIVGSNSVLPFMQIIAENFSHHWDFPPPSIEDTGTGRGFRLFGSGVSFQFPDIVATPRPMTESEWAFCEKHGVDAVTEIVIGLDAVVLTNPKASPQHNFTISQLFNAMAEKVQKEGRVVSNPYARWNRIDKELPDMPIEIMRPQPGSPVEDAVVQLVMIKGCESFPAILLLDEQESFRVCRMFRPYSKNFVKALKHTSQMLHWLSQNPNAFIFLPYAVYRDYTDRLMANAVNGVPATLESISTRAYPLSRPIYLYVKIPHVEAVPGLQKFLYETTSERAIGPDGYLVDKGFVPLDDRGRNQARDGALSLTPISR
ncbi:phosphate ABC transporter, periplasmic phosphate-binding family protein [delta proteobacterium NaphS2]|nr:phosphate ABC transporter, periplasmic phosphate-binding family protein [delta proteobacterium NaphS2]